MTARDLLVTLAVLACAARAGAAGIQGQVTHGTKPSASAGLLVEVLGLDAQENGITRQTKTDAQGRYRFDDLPAPAAYLVRARYDGLTFPGGGAAFRAGEEGKRETVDFMIFDKSEDASRLQLTAAQWVVMRSAGVWRIQQGATIANPNGKVVVVPQSQPAPLGVGLASGHGKVESIFGKLPDGVVVKGDVAEIRGPVFPGDEGFGLQIEYEIEASGDLVTEIAVPSGARDVAVYVQDFGVEVDAGGLHPSRPARQDDMIYQSFIGFDVPAGTRLPLHVKVLPPASSASLVVAALLAALGAGALLFFVAAPVVREALARDSAQESLEPESPAKAALAAALHDLEHDFETGKLSAEDRERLREDLRSEALGALARERLGSEASEPGVTAPAPACRSCGRTATAGDRFCATCGIAL